MAYLVRTLVFFAAMVPGIWGFVVLDSPWNFVAMFAAFLIGGAGSMWSFKRLATEQQRKDDLEARLFND